MLRALRRKAKLHDADAELRWWLEVWERDIRGGGLFGARVLELCGDAEPAPTYEGRRWQQARAEVRRVLEEAAIDDAEFFDGKVVVDVGPGPVGFPDACPARTSIAVEPLAPKLAEHGLLLDGSEAVYLAVPAERIPLLDATVDVVNARNSLDHVEDPAAAMAEIHRILRPGGTLILNVDVDHPATATEPHSFTTADVRALVAAFEVERERALPEPHGHEGHALVVVARKRG